MKINRLFVTLMACVAAVCAMAQGLTMTPYSRYGYGILNDNVTSMQRGMGGVGYAMNSGRQINVMNPASYAAIDSLTFLFDMGANFDMMWSQEGSNKEDNMSGGLDYITMAFPISKKIGASIGLLPYASTGYTFSQTLQYGSATHAGSGDISQLYFGLAINPFANAYIGANIAYMFGTTTNETYASTNGGSTSIFQRYLRVRDWHLDLGVQYDINLSPDSKVTLGFAYSPAKDLHGETYGISYDASADTKADTTANLSLKGIASIPATYGGGISYSWRSRLLVEADFTYQPWKDAKYPNLDNFGSSRFDNRWKAAAGLQYTPSPRGSYWGRTQYRIGAWYNHDYLMVKGNNIREIGAAFGVGLPVPGFKTVVNLCFEYKHRQATPDPLIKEQYFNITLGVNFNEMWFRKSKIY